MKPAKTALISSILTLFVASGVMTAAALMEPPGIDLPVLMYHHIADVGDSVVTVSAELFKKQLDYLDENGYETVSFDEIIAYANGEDVDIPEKPVAIVFDDGYESNYLIAYPELKARGDKATICLIGSCVGKDTYKDTGVPMLPYFSWDQAREMRDSETIALGSHTYDMHQYAPLETGRVRAGVVPFDDESKRDFVAAIREDYTKMSELFRENLGQNIEIFAYPNGQYSELSERVIESMGAKVTLTTRVGMNRIRRGDPKSLYLLRRYSINDSTDVETLQTYLDGKIPKKSSS